MPINFNDNFRDEDAVDRDRESASDWYGDLHDDSPVAVVECAKDILCTGITCKNSRNPCFHPSCQRRERKDGTKFCWFRNFGIEQDGQI